MFVCNNVVFVICICVSIYVCVYVCICCMHVSVQVHKHACWSPSRIFLRFIFIISVRLSLTDLEACHLNRVTCLHLLGYRYVKPCPAFFLKNNVLVFEIIIQLHHSLSPFLPLASPMCRSCFSLILNTYNYAYISLNTQIQLNWFI